MSRPQEKSTAVVRVTFFDENGNNATPTSVTWTLTNDLGTVVNSREDVVSTPGTYVDILLYGDDLDIGSYGQNRVLTVKSIYDSSLGNDLPLNGEFRFAIEDLLKIT